MEVVRVAQVVQETVPLQVRVPVVWRVVWVQVPKAVVVDIEVGRYRRLCRYPVIVSEDG